MRSPYHLVLVHDIIPCCQDKLVCTKIYQTGPLWPCKSPFSDSIKSNSQQFSNIIPTMWYIYIYMYIKLSDSFWKKSAESSNFTFFSDLSDLTKWPFEPFNQIRYFFNSLVPSFGSFVFAKIEKSYQRVFEKLVLNWKMSQFDISYFKIIFMAIKINEHFIIGNLHTREEERLFNSFW